MYHICHTSSNSSELPGPMTARSSAVRKPAPFSSTAPTAPSALNEKLQSFIIINQPNPPPRAASMGRTYVKYLTYFLWFSVCIQKTLWMLLGMSLVMAAMVCDGLCTDDVAWNSSNSTLEKKIMVWAQNAHKNICCKHSFTYIQLRFYKTSAKSSTNA